MKCPGDLRYTREHEWVKLEGDSARVGITEFAQAELGEIVYVELPEPGKKVEQGGALCVVESTKAASDVYAPLSGTVKEANPALKDKPSLINAGPYDEGWLAVLGQVDKNEISRLMTAEEYEAFVSEQG